MTDQPAVFFDRCSVTFCGSAGAVEALRGVTLSVKRGEFVSLIGPSGCGKSTLLRLAADVLAPTDGAVSVLGESPSAARRARRFSMVFQDPVLLPWRTVQQNVELPLELAGRPRAVRRSGAERTLDLVGLTGFERARPAQLSGGMRQRVAIARALTLEPALLLMDEPFAAVDEITRDRLNLELLGIWERTRAAVLFVTHSIEEAVYLSDRVIVLSQRPGRVSAELAIDLPRPRDRLELGENPQYHHYRTAVLEFLYRRQAHV
ncbi:MAG TPA: ABC transporter ATP-binding protein, partial [Chloroflexota bacterium]|nr:ABC transporter ATP-binding protein [Chloroflexota bacterium]